LQSHLRAAAAREKLAEEICPVFQAGKEVVMQDNGVREHQSFEALAGLKPQFDRKNGSVTPVTPRRLLMARSPSS